MESNNAAKTSAIDWINDDGVYRSLDDRFVIMRATQNYHSGEWWMRDNRTKREYFKDTLKDCKYIAEKYCMGSAPGDTE